uniref:Uncharacterized protein n=1 Tax=Skeletonema marinoi TaxID=267567 RepID=A0A7S2KF30_9STRA
MNIGVATIDAVGFITTFAPTESIAIFSTVITRDFVGTASIAAPYFGDTVRASILVTLRALFEINAVHNTNCYRKYRHLLSYSEGSIFFHTYRTYHQCNTHLHHPDNPHNIVSCSHSKCTFVFHRICRMQTYTILC